MSSICPAPRSWSPHTILVQDPDELLVDAVSKSSTFECFQHCKLTATDTCLRYREGMCNCLPGFVQRKYIVDGVEEAEKFVTKEAYTIEEREFSDLQVFTEVIYIYTENAAKPVCVLLFDASYAFDKVAFNVLFNELRDRSMCPRITKLLQYMYTHQSCYVNRGNEHSDSFNV